VLDAQFSRLLKLNADLNLADVMLLDAVQKHRPITEDAIKQLRQKGLIEGRKPALLNKSKFGRSYLFLTLVRFLRTQACLAPSFC
jgi:ATP-dependent DNA helicase RecG